MSNNNTRGHSGRGMPPHFMHYQEFFELNDQTAIVKEVYPDGSRRVETILNIHHKLFVSPPTSACQLYPNPHNMRAGQSAFVPSYQGPRMTPRVFVPGGPRLAPFGPIPLGIETLLRPRAYRIRVVETPRYPQPTQGTSGGHTGLGSNNAETHSRGSAANRGESQPQGQPGDNNVSGQPRPLISNDGVQPMCDDDDNVIVLD